MVSAVYLEAYEDLLKKSKKENHMQVSDLQENALRLADSIKGMEDYERIIEEFLMCTSGSYVAIQIMALFFCGRIMEEHKTWRGELDHLSFEVAGITSQKMFASWLKTFLAKRKVRTGTAGSKIYKKSLSGKPEAGNCGGRTGSQPQLSFYDHKERNGDHIPAAYDPGKVKYSKKTFR